MTVREWINGLRDIAIGGVVDEFPEEDDQEEEALETLTRCQP